MPSLHGAVAHATLALKENVKDVVIREEKEESFLRYDGLTSNSPENSTRPLGMQTFRAR